MRAIYNCCFESQELNRLTQSKAQQMMSIPVRPRRALFAGGLFLLVILLSCSILSRHFVQAAQTSTKPGAAKSAGTTKPTAKPSSPRSATLQTYRNIGKAYYEQGKYPESIIQFQKVIASGQALATDHMDLALGLMQADKLDESLGEMTTAKQMDPKL